MRARTSAAGILVAAVVVLALMLLGRWPLIAKRDREPAARPDEARVVFSVEVDPDVRVGSRATIRFHVRNDGPVAVRSLSVRVCGPLDVVHVWLVDVDGVFRTEGDDGWFVFGQSVRAGASRSPVVGIVPRAPGEHRFEFQAFDGDSPLVNTVGEPAVTALVLEVGP